MENIVTNTKFLPDIITSQVGIGLSLEDTKKVLNKLFEKDEVIQEDNQYDITVKNPSFTTYKKITIKLQAETTEFTQLIYTFQLRTSRKWKLGLLLFINALYLLQIFGLTSLGAPITIAILSFFPILVIDLIIVLTTTKSGLNRMFEKVILKRIITLGRIVKEHNTNQ